MCCPHRCFISRAKFRDQDARAAACSIARQRPNICPVEWNNRYSQQWARPAKFSSHIWSGLPTATHSLWTPIDGYEVEAPQRGSCTYADANGTINPHRIVPSFARGLILITRKAQRRGHFPDCPEPEAFRVESRRSWHHKWCIILGELAVLDPPSFAMLGQSVSGLILSRIPMLRHGYETRRNFRQRSLSTKPSVISPNGGIRNLSVVTSNTFPFQSSSTASNITVNLPIGIVAGITNLAEPPWHQDVLNALFQHLLSSWGSLTNSSPSLSTLRRPLGLL